MAYGQELSRKRVSTRILRAEEKIVTMYITAATGVFTSLQVNGDLGIGDNIKGLHISAVTLEADDFIVHDDFNVSDTVKALSVSGVTLFADSIKAGTSVVTSPSSWKMLSVSGVTLFADDVLVNDTVVALSVSGVTLFADDGLLANDLVVGDTIKALSVSGITLFSNYVSSAELLATNRLYVPTAITGAFLTPLNDAMMFVDEDQFKLYVVVGATLRFVDLMAM